jgi:hypothetical protein
MSAGNVLRRLIGAFLGGEVVNGTPVSVVPAIDDQVLILGNGTKNFDVKTFGNTTSDYQEWDASANKHSFVGAAILDVPAGQLQLGSVAVGATAAELNAAADVSARIVNTTATTLAVTATEHAGRIVKISSAAAIAVTMPASTGSGNVYAFVLNVAATATAHTIKVAASSTDIVAGCTIIAQTDTAQVNGFLTTATDDTITLNGTTQGGAKGCRVELIDIATNTWNCLITSGASGTVATPFSATV